MKILLLRPVPGNERFGLGPFFRIEPLGMEYIASALEAQGHRVVLADLRFSKSLRGTPSCGRRLPAVAHNVSRYGVKSTGSSKSAIACSIWAAERAMTRFI